jgi:hypothetical protein
MSSIGEFDRGIGVNFGYTFRKFFLGLYNNNNSNSVILIIIMGV